MGDLMDAMVLFPVDEIGGGPHEHEGEDLIKVEPRIMNEKISGGERELVGAGGGGREPK